MREALTNLIFNAVDAMPLGGTIQLSTRLDDGVVVEVTDTGTGHVARGVSAHVRTVLHHQGRRGTGLGLATVLLSSRGNLDGKIDVELAEGRGTTIRMSFQAAVPDGALHGACSLWWSTCLKRAGRHYASSRLTTNRVSPARSSASCGARVTW